MLRMKGDRGSTDVRAEGAVPAKWITSAILMLVSVTVAVPVQAAGATSLSRMPAAVRVALAAPEVSPGEGAGAAWCTEYGTDGARGIVSYDGVWACGPDHTIGPTPFDSNGTASFQCVELSERFLWAIYGLPPIFGGTVDGASLVSLYHSAHRSIAVGQPGPSQLPQPGDVISFGEGGDVTSSAGHTAVVVSPPNSSGNFTIMSQNWADTAGQETVHVDLSGAHDGQVQLPGSSFWNAASFLETNPLLAAVRAVQTADGHLQLFQVAGGRLEENWYSPSTGHVGGWVSPAGMQDGAQAVGTPVAVARPRTQVIDLFVRSTDGLIRETWYNWGNGHWGGWIPIGGASFTGDPQAARTSDGHDQIFATSAGTLRQNWFDPATGHIGDWITI
jgi:hypothetical protein